ncbi:hypothetical protein [Acidovorax radicis]|uniref:hypothetical protein n=1 Tax=Acidovorax radicis TaxID=758826 RepID=UPI001CF83882|nr:hypothetical protein [Acidovorax radicis]UCU98559.1 hypothetical protein KI609_18975 [Acidovorax radicis]
MEQITPHYPVVYGSQNKQARTVLVYGNCQAPSAAQSLATLDDLHEDFALCAL